MRRPPLTLLILLVSAACIDIRGGKGLCPGYAELTDPRFACPSSERAAPQFLCDATLPPGPDRKPPTKRDAFAERTLTAMPALYEYIFSRNYYPRCSDIFESQSFRNILSNVPPMNGEALIHEWFIMGSRPPFWTPREIDDLSLVQRRLGTVFAQIRGWSYCHRINRQGGLTIHGEYQPETKTVTLYSTACDTATLYSEDIGEYAVANRYVLIASHELGHVIDDVNGQLTADPDPQRRETRATAYGTYFAECACRHNEDLLRLGMRQTHGPVRALVACNLKRFEALERALRAMRQHEVELSTKTGVTTAMRCASESGKP